MALLARTDSTVVLHISTLCISGIVRGCSYARVVRVLSVSSIVRRHSPSRNLLTTTMTDTKYYYADRNNVPIGPYSIDDLRQLQVNGQLTAETYVIEEGGQAWKPLMNIFTLARPVGGVPLPPLPPTLPNTERKSKLVAGLLGILLGVFGVHNFYLGNTSKGLAQCLITVLSLGIFAAVSAIWGLVEGIMILTGSINRDAKGIPLRD